MMTHPERSSPSGTATRTSSFGPKGTQPPSPTPATIFDTRHGTVMFDGWSVTITRGPIAMGVPSSSSNMTE